MSGIGPISETPPPVDIYVGSGDLRFDVTGVAPTTASAAYLSAFQVFRPVTVTTAMIAVITQGSGPPNFDIGIYDDAGVRLASTGAKAMETAGTRPYAFTAPVTLYPGRRYWSAIAWDAAGSAIQGSMGVASDARQNGLAAMAGASYPLPAPLAAAPPACGGNARAFAIRYY